MIEAKYILTGEVNVATQYIEPNLEEIEITPSKEEQVITPNEDYDGFSKVTVNPILLENIEATPTKEVQTINRSEDKYIESVKVNAIPDEYIVPSGELEITQNGNYDVSDKASVNVETSGADLSEYFTETITGSPYSSTIGILQCLKKLPAFENTGTNCGYMFNGCSKLESLDLSNFDTSQVTNMVKMFNSCSSLTSLDLSNFNTSKVTSMNGMFNVCSKLESLDLSNFDTSQVTNMAQMFNGCSKLESLDLSNFNTSKVTEISMMFQYCKSLQYLDIRNFDFTKVTSSSQMFGGSGDGVSNNCLIIVKDDTAKTWITGKFSRLTNVKTVAEYEAQ